MTHLYISTGDLPEAKQAADVRLYVGGGWLSLVREAMDIIGNSEIAAIREDAGRLRIELILARPTSAPRCARSSSVHCRSARYAVIPASCVTRE